MISLKLVVGIFFIVVGVAVWIYADNKMKSNNGKALRFFFPTFGPNFFPTVWIWLLGIVLMLTGLFFLK